MSMIASIIARLLIALMFLVSGIGKVADPTQASQMLESANLPGTLAMPVGVFEIVAAVLLAIGLMVRLTAILLAGYVALTILFFHHNFTDPMGLTTALSHGALIGGLLAVFAYGQMRGSYDYMRAERRAQQAEVRAARAEGLAEGTRTVPREVVTDVDHDGVAEVRPRRRWF